MPAISNHESADNASTANRARVHGHLTERPDEHLNDHCMVDLRDQAGTGGVDRESRRWEWAERTVAQATPAAVNRDRRWSTDLVWICDTRLSVTPKTWPISASVSPSS